MFGVVHVGQDARFGIFLKFASRLVPDGWVELKSFGYRCYFRAFQVQLDILDTKNIGNGPVVAKLQLFEVAQFSKNPKKHHFRTTGLSFNPGPHCRGQGKHSFPIFQRNLPTSNSSLENHIDRL